MADVILGQQRELAVRREALQNRIAVLEVQGRQLETEIVGYEEQIAGQDRQLALIAEEIDGARQLVDRGLERRPRLLVLEREQAEIETRIAANQAAIARAEQRIGETELQILDLRTTRQEQVSAELTEVEASLADIRDQLTAVEDVLVRTEIVAPVDGIAVNQRIFTIGGVVAPGEPLIDIVPTGDRLLVEARVAPTDIDNIFVGAEAEVKLSAYADRDLTRLMGMVETVSADAITSERTSETSYTAMIAVDPQTLDDLGEAVELTAGMPAEVMISTGSQTVLDYLVRPFSRTLGRALREP